MIRSLAGTFLSACSLWVLWHWSALETFFFGILQKSNPVLAIDFTSQWLMMMISFDVGPWTCSTLHTHIRSELDAQRPEVNIVPSRDLRHILIKKNWNIIIDHAFIFNNYIHSRWERENFHFRLQLWIFKHQRIQSSHFALPDIWHMKWTISWWISNEQTTQHDVGKKMCLKCTKRWRMRKMMLSNLHRRSIFVDESFEYLRTFQPHMICLIIVG